MIIAYSLEVLNEITTNRVGLGKTGEVYLVTRDKTMLTESRFMENASLKQRIDTEPIRKSIKSGEEMVGIYKGYRGVSVVGASMYMPEYGWTLLAEMDESEVFAPIKTISIIVSILWIGMAGTVIIFGIIYAISMTRSIEELIHATGRFSQGELEYRIKITGKDEMGILASRFNIMAEHLKDEMKRQKSLLDALRKSEASLVNAQRIAHLGSWDWDIIKNKIHWSDEHYRIFGVTPQSFDATYEAILERIHPDDREFLKKSVNNALYEGKPCCIDVRIVLPDGSERSIHTQAEVVFDHTGKPIQISGTTQDITERKMIKKKLIEIQSRLEYLLTNSPAVIYSSKPFDNYGVTFMSSNSKRMIGYEPNEFVENPSFRIDHIHPEDIFHVLDEMKYGIEKGSHILVYRFKHKDGIYRWIHDEMKVTYDSHGKPQEIVGFWTDITQQKHIEDEVKSVARFSSENPNPVLRVAKDGTLLYANLSSSPFLRDWKCEMGKQVPDFIFQIIKEALHTKSIRGVEVEQRGKIFSFTVVPVTTTTTDYVNLYGMDITKLKQIEQELRTLNESLEERIAERTLDLAKVNRELQTEIDKHKQTADILMKSESKYRLLLENLPQRVFYKDKNSIYISCNENFAKDLHIKAEEISGKTDYNFFPKELADKYRDNDRKVIESGQKIDRDQEYLINDKESFIHMIKVPVKDEEGHTIGILSSYLDITEKIVLQKEVERSKYLASLGELAAGIAHEINNPVTGVINCAQILFNKSQEESRERDLATRILKEGDRIAKIVHSLLLFSRPGSKEEKNIVNIHEILSDTLALTGAQLRKEGIMLTLDVPQKLPEIVANRQLIQQVFVNVINNARYALNQKYPSTHSNKILEISGEEITIDHCPYIKITICDHGTGIPARIRDKVMNPFFTTKPTGKGTGLGLSISHGIVKDHGGKLFIKSVEGEYTKLIIILPAQSKTA